MDYNNCPKCGEKYFFKKKETKFEEFFLCKKCKYKFYNNPKSAVVGLVINNENKILLVRRAIEPYKKYWDLPGGFVNSSEEPDLAIIREIKEELDISVSVINIEGAFLEEYKNKGRNNEIYKVIILVYKLQINNPNKTMQAMDDIDKYKFFDCQKLPKNIAFPEKKSFLIKYFNKK